jgi:genome maintenance exonuclease 1
MKWNKLYDYPKSVRELIENKRHYAIGTEKLPSVTTILSATASSEKQESLKRWKEKVGEKEAERVKNVAASRGTAMHSYLEYHLEGQGLLDLTEIGQEAERMAKTIIDKGLPDLEEIWGLEATLHYPGRYAGATDLCGVYLGRESIVDFKQSNRPKKEEWIEDYYYQLVAYATAHNEVYGTSIDQGVILMCTPDLFFQRFILNGKRFREYQQLWLERVERYYALVETSRRDSEPVQLSDINYG